MAKEPWRPKADAETQRAREAAARADFVRGFAADLLGGKEDGVPSEEEAREAIRIARLVWDEGGDGAPPTDPDDEG